MRAIVDDDACERFREFVMRRSWLGGGGKLLTAANYASLKKRDGKFWGSLTENEAYYLVGFMDGWRQARH